MTTVGVLSVQATPTGLQIWRTSDDGEVKAILEIAEGTRVVINANADVQVKCSSTRGWTQRQEGDLNVLVPPP
jgi:hypothetical protein